MCVFPTAWENSGGAVRRRCGNGVGSNGICLKWRLQLQNKRQMHTEKLGSRLNRWDEDDEGVLLFFSSSKRSGKSNTSAPLPPPSVVSLPFISFHKTSVPLPRLRIYNPKALQIILLLCFFFLLTTSKKENFSDVIKNCLPFPW